MLNEIFYVKGRQWEHAKSVRECVAAFLSKQKDGPYTVTIKRFAEPRSGNQNRYYWALLEYLAPELGYESKDACHAMLMQECGFGHFVTFKGKEYFDRKSSTDLDKEQFAKLIEKCFEVAAFLNEGREGDAWIILPRAEETNT